MSAMLTALAEMVRHSCPESGPDNAREAGAAHDRFCALVQPARREMDELRAENARLRALPVIETCGECRHLDVTVGLRTADFWCRKGNRRVYEPDAPRSGDDGKGRRPPVPPDWCALRKETTR